MERINSIIDVAVSRFAIDRKLSQVAQQFIHAADLLGARPLFVHCNSALKTRKALKTKEMHMA
jgi:hypothetical protein